MNAMGASPGPVGLNYATASRIDGIGWCAIGDIGGSTPNLGKRKRTHFPRYIIADFPAPGKSFLAVIQLHGERDQIDSNKMLEQQFLLFVLRRVLV